MDIFTENEWRGILSLAALFGGVACCLGAGWKEVLGVALRETLAKVWGLADGAAGGVRAQVEGEASQ